MSDLQWSSYVEVREGKYMDKRDKAHLPDPLDPTYRTRCGKRPGGERRAAPAGMTQCKQCRRFHDADVQWSRTTTGGIANA